MSAEIPVADIVDQPIDVNRLLEAVRTPDAGAIVVFLGTVRKQTQGRETDSLTYEAYASMAAKELRSVLHGVGENYPVCRLAAEHRTGDLLLGDVAVVVAVSGPHRDETFAAGRAAIDRIKQSVPIWKREHWADGEIEWVDPTAIEAAPNPAANDASSLSAREMAP